MKIYRTFFIAIFFCQRNGVSGSYDSPNVRTVLFRKSDLSKECWNREELELLTARRMMQELVPKKVPRNIPLMLDYFKSCLETVKEMAPSRSTHALMLAALADTVGGYLQGFGLPATNEAYYEGNLNYCVAKQLHELEDAFKKTLRTDGGGWSRPVEAARSNEIAPLRFPTAVAGNPCANLITNIDTATPQLSATNRECECAVTKETPHNYNGRMNVRIGVPFLDDCHGPTAVAIPFKDRSLFSLSSKSSCDALVKYYVQGLTCINQVSGPQSYAADTFINNFRNWLEKSVLPHLHDEIWYPGFWSVLRIIETMEERGPIKVEAETNENEFNNNGEEPNKQQTSVLFYIAIVIAVLLVFWVIVFCIYLIYHYCGQKRDGSDTSSSSSSSESTPVLSTLVSLYCGGKDSSEGLDVSNKSEAKSTRLTKNESSKHRS